MRTLSLKRSRFFNPPENFHFALFVLLYYFALCKITVFKGLNLRNRLRVCAVENMHDFHNL